MSVLDTPHPQSLTLALEIIVLTMIKSNWIGYSWIQIALGALFHVHSLALSSRFVATTTHVIDAATTPQSNCLLHACIK